MTLQGPGWLLLELRGGLLVQHSRSPRLSPTWHTPERDTHLSCQKFGDEGRRTRSSSLAGLYETLFQKQTSGRPGGQGMDGHQYDGKSTEVRLCLVSATGVGLEAISASYRMHMWT